MVGLTCNNNLVEKRQNTVFKMPWDKSARVVTWVSVGILLLAVALCVYFAMTDPGNSILYIGLTLLIVLIPVCVALRSPRSLVLTDRALVVHKVLGDKEIAYCDMKNVVLMRKYSAIRVYASGDLFGYVGLFWNREFGRHWVFAGSLRQPICVTLVSGKRYVLGCADNADLMEELRNRTAKHSL